MPTDNEIKNATETLSTVNAADPMFQLPLDQIRVDEDFNVRKSYDPKLFARLKEDIRKNGLTNPLVVRRSPKGYDLIGGFTRMRALREIEREERKAGGKAVGPVFVKVTVKEYASDLEAHFDNVRENVLRGELTPYEIASKAKFIMDKYSVKGAPVARSLGIDPKYCNNLVRVLREAAPEIVADWAKKHPAATMNALLPLLPKDHETQLERWELIKDPQKAEREARAAAKGKKGSTDDGDGFTSPGGIPAPGPKRPSLSTIKSALEAVEASSEKPEWKRGALAALKFAAAESKTIPGVYNPKTSQSQGGKKKSKGTDKAAKKENRADA